MIYGAKDEHSFASDSGKLSFLIEAQSYIQTIVTHNKQKTIRLLHVKERFYT